MFRHEDDEAAQVRADHMKEGRPISFSRALVIVRLRILAEKYKYLRFFEAAIARREEGRRGVWSAMNGGKP